MQKKIVGAMGVISALAALDCAHAAPPSAAAVNEFLRPQSFAELLEPVPNALALLKRVDEAQAAQGEAAMRLAQYYGYDYGYPHHHHHHHHHHSHFQPAWGAPVVEVEPRGYGGTSAHERRLQIIWCTQHPGRC